MRYITEIGLTSRFFQAKLAYELVYHNYSGTLPLNVNLTTAKISTWTSCFRPDIQVQAELQLKNTPLPIKNWCK